MFKELFSLIFAGLITMGSWVGLPVHDGGFNIEKDTDKIEETASSTDRKDVENAGERGKIKEKGSQPDNRSINNRDDNDYEDDEDENESDDDNKGSESSNINTQVSSTKVIPTKTTSTNTINASYTITQVSTHKNATSCWTAVNGSVYDVTPFIKQHPGGSGAILSLCGIDGSSAFNGQHGGQARPASELAGFKIGVLVK